MFFFSAVWLYFYRLFITDQQVGLLLAPSVVGIGLFGATESPGSEIEGKFGAISLVHGRHDGSYLVDVVMPYPAIAGLDRLLIG